MMSSILKRRAPRRKIDAYAPNLYNNVGGDILSIKNLCGGH